jgi:tetratricopeptide (TPR) repeat protein
VPASSLTTEQSAALAEAIRWLQHGDARQAAEGLAPLIRGGCRDADLLLTYSIACEQLGLLDEAAGAVQAGLEQSPERADLWARLGSLFEDFGRSADAVPMLERAVALDGSRGSFWCNLGVAALTAGMLDRAAEALRKSVELEPDSAPAWGALGVVQQQCGELDNAEASLRRALELDPQSRSTAHNLAATLRVLDKPSEGLTVVEAAMRTGPTTRETKMLRAHLLDEAGRLDDAVQAYRGIIAEFPTEIEAHELLSTLLPQLNPDADPLAAYDEASRKASTLELYRSAVQTAWNLKRPVDLERWSAEARARFGELPDLQLMQGLAQGLQGDAAKALELIEPLICAGFTPALSHAAYYRLKLGDLKEAESHALAATRANFADQSAWAYLTVIWRMLDDPRERWLADYDRLVMPVDLQPPDGFEDIGRFIEALASELEQLHGTLHHPADQSLRQGTQTRGSLFGKRSPRVRQLAETLEQAIREALHDLPADATHPFLSRNTGRARFLGSWSVRLRSGGFHVSHIHQEGWLSSALYVALPPEVTATSDDPAPPGSLTFGVPDSELGLDLPPRRIEFPKVGRLVLFPSYFWHGTMPFESQDYRLTVAFDAAPA